MRAEGRDRLLDALLVADIGIDPIEHGQGAPLVGRNVKSRLVHERQETRGLHGHRLAAGVWPGDNQHRPLAAQIQIDRHRRIAKNGMAGAEQAHHGGPWLGRTDCAPQRADAAHRDAVPRPGQDEVEPGD